MKAHYLLTSRQATVLSIIIGAHRPVSLGHLGTAMGLSREERAAKLRPALQKLKDLGLIHRCEEGVCTSAGAGEVTAYAGVDDKIACSFSCEMLYCTLKVDKAVFYRSPLDQVPSHTIIKKGRHAEHDVEASLKRARRIVTRHDRAGKPHTGSVTVLAQEEEDA